MKKRYLPESNHLFLSDDILNSDGEFLQYILGYASGKPNSELKIVINSSGGSTLALRMLYESAIALKEQLSICTLVRKNCVAASAAAMIFLLGNKRVLSREARLLFHYARPPEGGIYLSDKEAREYLARKNLLQYYGFSLEETNKMLLDSFCNSTGLSADFADSLFKADRLMCSEEALDLGIATQLTP